MKQKTPWMDLITGQRWKRKKSPNNLKIEQEESSNLENTEGKEIKFVKMSRMSAICETISKS